jgi:hypothetical protein
MEQYPENFDNQQPSTGFFRITPEEVIKYFNLMEEVSQTPEYVKKDIKDNVENYNNVNKRGSCRNIGDCFIDGQRIRHKIGKKIKIASYDSFKNGIICEEGKFYKSISSFALTHHRIYNPNRKSVNGWVDCDYEVDGEWISTQNLPKT